MIAFPRRAMEAALIICAACLPMSLAPFAAAQGNPAVANVVPESEAVTVYAKIQSIDPSTRKVTLLGRSGSRVTVTAGPIVRLDLLKVGDTVNAKYDRSVAFVVSQPQGGNGTPRSVDESTLVTSQPAQAPGGVGVRVTKMSGLVVGIDMAAHRVDVVSPSGGGVYTVDVTDPARIPMLSQLKVGDTITAVVSETLAVSIQPAPRGWF